VAGPRPGTAARARMAPERRPDYAPGFSAVPVSKEAGALILLYPREGELDIILTRRTETVAMHKGQVSLPGGAREEGEELVETARREASEELGIDPDRIEILGPPLTPLFIPVSGFWVTPFVGYCEAGAEFVPAPDEVIELIDVPLRSLLDESSVDRETWEIQGEAVSVPFFRLEGHKVWGATAMMLSEFAAMLREQVN
jgi:8-oxo-dGTP pyrophosphatase MutT (NUDIX family)